MGIVNNLVSAPLQPAQLQWLALLAIVTIICGLNRFVSAWRLESDTSTKNKTPQPVAERWPLLGAVTFWTERLSFFQRAVKGSLTGNFSFWAGPYHVVGLSGDDARHAFYHTKQLGIAEGYAVLGGNLPNAQVDGEEGQDIWPKQEFLTYLRERVRRMLQRDVLRKRLPELTGDVKLHLDEMDIIINPFESVYKLVLLLILRTVGCHEVTTDRGLLDRLLEYYNGFTSSATMSVIVFPWFPSPNLIKRYFNGARLYFTLKAIVNERQKLTAQGIRKFDDPLQQLIDNKCGVTHIAGILLGAVFAGQQNTSVNAAWILVHLVHNTYWGNQVRGEILNVANKYNSDDSIPLVDRLASIPLEAWETEFPTIRLCIKENLRLHGLGAQLRRNTGEEVFLGKSGEVIPRKAFVAYHTADVHLDSSIYADPLEWDPSRYLPYRAEDQKKPLAWVGWGAGRHYCLGEKLANLGLHMIVALFFATFEEANLCDKTGNLVSDLPEMDLEAWVSDRPKQGDAYIKVRRREE